MAPDMPGWAHPYRNPFTWYADGGDPDDGGQNEPDPAPVTDPADDWAPPTREEWEAQLSELLNYMTSDDLKSWQFLRAADECAAALCGQHPFLADLQPPQDLDKPDLYTWLIEAERTHGDTIEVTPLTDWQQQDPGIELLDRIHLARLRTTDQDPHT